MEKEINRLSFENILWLVFIALGVASIFANNLEKMFVATNNKYYKEKANKIFVSTVIITILIYLYFFKRNYDAYLECKDKRLFQIKLIGSCLLIAGSICLLYFQINDKSYLGAPEL